MRRRRSLKNDCIAVLTFVSKHRNERQTWKILSEGTGIPYETLRQMVLWFRHDPNNWALRNYATEYGYLVKFIGNHREGKILDVEFIGIPDDLWEYGAVDYYIPEDPAVDNDTTNH